MGKIKNFILWNYSRETSIYVIFCLLIVAFIFLTPKSWFTGRGILATRTRQITVKATDISVDKAAMQARVREITGDPATELVGWRETKDDDGEAVYEIEIK
ncbi:MAG: hypothetical protein ACRD6X_16850 [Pyrinomonadaceae bacterium]